jgi:hypothetical protein
MASVDLLSAKQMGAEVSRKEISALTSIHLTALSTARPDRRFLHLDLAARKFLASKKREN